MKTNIRHSFKLKLCAWIFGISFVVFLLTFVANLYYVSDEVRHDVRATAWAKIDYVVKELHEGLTSTEVSAENLISISKSPLVVHKRDSIFSLLEHFLDANPLVQGVAVGFDKEALTTDTPQGFCPYVMHMPDGTYLRRDVAEVRDYANYSWYKDIARKEGSKWTKPFREANGTIITAYTRSLYNTEGQYIGVLAVDLGLNKFNKTLQDIKPYPSSLLTVIDQGGTFIAHPNSDYILNMSIDSLSAQQEKSNQAILDSIKLGKRGMGYFEDSERGKVAVFYTQEPKTGWTITLEVPVEEVAPGLAHMGHVLMLIMGIGIILLVVVSLAVIHRLTKPLEKFAVAAREISKGNFDSPLPEIKSRNELYDLRQAMASMKGSLTTYISQLEETTKSKATIEAELNTARKIQMAMVPKIFPPYPDRKEIDIYGTLIPAKAVGGDLYDFLLDGDDFYFCIGDVSGKGVPASLFMAITRSLFRNNVTHAKSPAAVAKLLNNAIAQGNEENMFVTMFIGCCNLKTGHFSCCNCGHNIPATNGVLLSTDAETPLVGPGDKAVFMSQLPTNIPIGIIEDFDYQEVSMRLKSGVKIMLYTDGITEAENRKAELYSDERLLSVLSAIDASTSAVETVNTVIEDVNKHADGAEQSDDITALCIFYCPKEQ